jgi:hypothetical protein
LASVKTWNTDSGDGGAGTLHSIVATVAPPIVTDGGSVILYRTTASAETDYIVTRKIYGKWY